MSGWIRYRFHAYEADYRPVKFPPPGPYWCSGYGDGYAILIAWLPESANLLEWWPEAAEVDETAEGPPEYTSRFPKPDWYEPG